MIHKNTLPMGWRLQTPRLPSSKPATRNSVPKSTAETKSPWACKIYKGESSYRDSSIGLLYTKPATKNSLPKSTAVSLRLSPRGPARYTKDSPVKGTVGKD